MTQLSFLLLSLCAVARGDLPRLGIDHKGDWVIDATNEPVKVVGCNLGNWLLLEQWMNNIDTSVLYDQYLMEEDFRERFGEAGRKTIMDAWRDNFIQERDFDTIKDKFGFNMVRIPFLWSIVEDEDTPFTLRADGTAWKYLDWAVAQAKARDMYVVLDLHGAAGGQNLMDHCGRSGQNLLWGSAELQARTQWLWREVAERYADEPVVCAFDLLNEPWDVPSDEELEAVVEDLFAVVREAAPETIISVPAQQDGFEFYPWPVELGWEDVVYTMHPYPGIPNFGTGEPIVDVHLDFLVDEAVEWEKNCTERGGGMLIGEMQVAYKSSGGGEMMRHHMNTYSSFGWATSLWSYKVFRPAGGFETDGLWGAVTNDPARGLMGAFNTWTCPDGWSGSFEESCGEGQHQYVALTTGPHYLVIKAGTASGNLNVFVDELTLTEVGSSTNLLTGSGSPTWSQSEWLPFTADLDAVEAQFGSELSLTNPTSNVNGGVFQEIYLQEGVTYELNGLLGDRQNSVDTWLEVFLWSESPVDGKDYSGYRPFGSDFKMDTVSYEEMLEYTEYLKTMEPLVDEDLSHWMLTSDCTQWSCDPFSSSSSLVPFAIEDEPNEAEAEDEAAAEKKARVEAIAAKQARGLRVVEVAIPIAVCVALVLGALLICKARQPPTSEQTDKTPLVLQERPSQVPV